MFGSRDTRASAHGSLGVLTAMLASLELMTLPVGAMAQTPAVTLGGAVTGARSIENEVEDLLAVKCPARLVAPSPDTDESVLIAFDDAFAPLITPAYGARPYEVALEAYRRCIDRAITQIQRTPHYALIDPNADEDCFDCAISLSDLALQIPRLRQLQGLTYLDSDEIADQDPAKALALIRQSIADFDAVQAEFRSDAERLIDRRERALDEQRRAAESAARRETTIGLITGLAAVGMGAAAGLGRQQTTQIAEQAMQRQFALANANLGVRLAAIQQNQVRIDAVNSGISDRGNTGAWRDDGIRVVLPRLSLWESNGLKRWGATFTGGMGDEFHFDYLVHVIANLPDGREFSCTGSIVAPRLVLTNRHCVQDPEDGTGIAPRAYTVVRDSYEGGEGGVVRRSNKRAVVKWASPDLNISIQEDRSRDWALLVLDKAFFEGGLDLVSPAELARHPKFRIAVAGYSSDLNDGDQVTMDWGCLGEWDDGLIRHLCRTFSGASGSPIIAVDGSFGRHKVLGVHAASYRDPNDPAAGLKSGAASQQLYDTWQDTKAEYAR